MVGNWGIKDLEGKEEMGFLGLEREYQDERKGSQEREEERQ